MLFLRSLFIGVKFLILFILFVLVLLIILVVVYWGLFMQQVVIEEIDQVCFQQYKIVFEIFIVLQVVMVGVYVMGVCIFEFNGEVYVEELEFYFEDMQDSFDDMNVGLDWLVCEMWLGEEEQELICVVMDQVGVFCEGLVDFKCVVLQEQMQVVLLLGRVCVEYNGLQGQFN